MQVRAAHFFGHAKEEANAWSYDSLGRLREILYDDDSSIVFDLDDLGNRIAIYENPPPSLKAESSTEEQKKK